MDSLSSDKLSGINKDVLLDQVNQEIAIARAQTLIEKMTEKCFNKCISKPGSSLDNSDKKCISMCMDRYLDSWNIVYKAYLSRLQQH